MSFIQHVTPVIYDKKLEGLRGAIAAGEGFTLFSDKSQIIGRVLARLAFLAELEQVHFCPTSLDAEYSTITFTAGFNGTENQLYIIVTADNKTGAVVAISANYVALKDKLTSDWGYHSTARENAMPQNALRKVFEKDRIISKRPFFFDVAYGPARTKRNDPGMVVKPVLAAYRHFALVHMLTHSRQLSVQHWLEHESFLYGACLMANRADIHQQRCAISFVYEKGARDPTTRLRRETFRSDIIWNDTWHHYSQKTYELAVCHLTRKDRPCSFRQATLQPAYAFQEYLFRHPIWPQLTRLAPRNVVHLLEYLAAEYNRGRGLDRL